MTNAKRTAPDVLLAPAASRAGAAHFPGAARPPGVSDHLVEPETREEMVRGRRVIALPALPPHADRHIELDYVVRAHVRDGYVGSSDLLTRFGPQSDFATDTCIRKDGVDPATGQRYLEELAFEVVSTQSSDNITTRAEDVTARGVRRLFAIFVKAREVREWLAAERKWKKLGPGDLIDDPCLLRPIAVEALLAAAAADDAVAEALIAKKNPVVMNYGVRERSAGEARGLGNALLTILAARGIDVPDRARRHILDTSDGAELQRWLARAASAHCLADVLDASG
jgi:hypothetical protein